MEKKIKYTGIVLAIMVLATIILAFTKITLIEAFRIVFGSVYVLFLPGFLATYIFFPNKLNNKEGIDVIERIALSFALSIAVVPLLVFYLNLIGMKITTLNTFLTVLGVIVIESIIIYIRKKK